MRAAPGELGGGASLLALAAGGAVLASAWALDRARRGRPRDTVGPRTVGPPADVPPWFGAALGHLGLDADPAATWPSARLLSLVVVVLVGVSAPGLVAVAFGVGVAAAVAGPVVRRRASPGRRPGDDQLVAAVEVIGGALVTGSSLAQAVARAGASPAGGAVGLDAVADGHARGRGLHEALDAWAAASPQPGATLVADALALAGTTGGSQARALAGVGATLRERQSLVRVVRSLGEAARATALVLVVTPLAFAGLATVLDRRVGSFLLRSPGGWACLAVGAGLDLAGAWWMRRAIGAVT